MKVDPMVVTATSAALAAKKATSTIPIVMSSVGDPVGQGIIASLARLGGNITGLASLTAELGGKRLEISKKYFQNPLWSRSSWEAIGAEAENSRRNS